MDKIKEFVVAYKWPILAAVFTMMLIGVYQLGIHHQTKAEQEQQPQIVTQEQTQSAAGLKDALDISNKNDSSFKKYAY